MELVNISKEEFNEFIVKNKIDNPNQSKQKAIAYDLSGQEYDIYGLKNEEGEIMVAGLYVYFRAMKFYRIARCIRGPVGAVEDIDTFNVYMNALKKELAKKNVIKLNIVPNIEYHKRDIDGKIIEGTKANDKVIADYRDIGLNHSGFYDGYLTDSMRWYFIKDLSKYSGYEEILESYDRRTRRTINQAKRNGVKVCELNRDQIPIAYDLFAQVSDREDLTLRDLNFFYNQYDSHKKDGDHIKFTAAYINVIDYEKKLEDRLEKISKKMTEYQDRINQNPENKKSRNMLNQENNAYQATERRLTQIEDMKREAIDGRLYLAAGMFYLNSNVLSYYNGGSVKEYLHIGGGTYLQDEMIRYALENNYKIYDFYGTFGDYSGHEDNDSIYEFKRGFGGRVVEYIGEFEMPIKPIMNKVYNFYNKR